MKNPTNSADVQEKSLFSPLFTTFCCFWLPAKTLLDLSRVWKGTKKARWRHHLTRQRYWCLFPQLFVIAHYFFPKKISLFISKHSKCLKYFSGSELTRNARYCWKTLPTSILQFVSSKTLLFLFAEKVFAATMWPKKEGAGRRRFGLALC